MQNFKAEKKKIISKTKGALSLMKSCIQVFIFVVSLLNLINNSLVGPSNVLKIVNLLSNENNSSLDGMLFVLQRCTMNIDLLYTQSNYLKSSYLH